MSSEAIFSTERRDNETVFRVQPASAAGMVFITILSLGLLIAIFSISSNPIFLTVMIVFWLFTCGLALLTKFLDAKSRMPVTIIVNRNGLSVEDKFFPADDIAELSLMAPKVGQVASSTSMAFAGTGMTGSTFALGATLGAAGLQGARNAGLAIAAENNARTISLLLRKRSHSKPITLVYGLTPKLAKR